GNLRTAAGTEVSLAIHKGDAGASADVPAEARGDRELILVVQRHGHDINVHRDLVSGEHADGRTARIGNDERRTIMGAVVADVGEADIEEDGMAVAAVD